MPVSTLLRRRRPMLAGTLIAALLVSLAGVLVGAPQAASAITTSSSSVRGSDGSLHTVTNHLTPEAHSGGPREWLLVWSGADSEDPEARDFMAVVDATRESRSYGKVVNTVTIDSQTGNEPHHMQYVWHKGDHIYAAGILSDTVYIFDSTHLPELRLTGVNLPVDTPCGSVPDAFQVLEDGTAYGSYMGGPKVPGPCTYTDGQVRVGNGYGGSPGEVVRISPDGRTLAEIPTATEESEDPELCHNRPELEVATCANPHGIAVREDLDRMVTADYTEIRNNLDPTVPLNPFWLRDTVRIFDISDRNAPELVSVSRLPTGPRDDEPAFDEQRMVMEAAATNQPHNRGAFVSTMAGGAVYYTPDITDPEPQWREVFDDTAAFREFDDSGMLSGSNSGGSWLAVSPDDRFLFHAVMGADWRLPRDVQTGMVYVLDIRKLLAAGNDPQCQIDTLAEVEQGGEEPDCPALVSVLPIKDELSPGVGVGPHWGAMDNFRRIGIGWYVETKRIRRIATANYFLAAVGLDGDHRVCMIDVSRRGELSLDRQFRDEHTGETCVNFNRTEWPHGPEGFARPHGVLFTVSDEVLLR